MQSQLIKKRSIFVINLIIFLAYYFFGILFQNFYKNFGITSTFFDLEALGGIFYFSGFLIHGIILVLISIVKGIWGIRNKYKTNALQYFFTAIFLFILGTGAAIFAFSSGMIELNW